MKLSLDPGWPHAIAHWRVHGRTDLIERLIMQGRYIPKDCRPMLNDIISGRAKRRRGRPPVADDLPMLIRNWSIRLAYQDMRDERVKDEQARIALGKQHHLDPETIKTIVSDRVK